MLAPFTPQQDATSPTKASAFAEIVSRVSGKSVTFFSAQFGFHQGEGIPIYLLDASLEVKKFHDTPPVTQEERAEVALELNKHVFDGGHVLCTSVAAHRGFEHGSNEHFLATSEPKGIAFFKKQLILSCYHHADQLNYCTDFGPSFAAACGHAIASVAASKRV